MKKASDLHDFDVLAEISRRDGRIMFAPLGSNCRTINYSARRGGTEFTIGFPGNLCFDVEAGKFRGGLVLVDGKEFDRVKAEMEADRG